MPFWDFDDDPFEWLKGRVTKRRIPGEPTVPGRESRNSSKNPWDILSRTTDTSFNSSGTHMKGKFGNPSGLSILNRARKRALQEGIAKDLSILNAPPSIEDILGELSSLQDPSRYMQDQGSLAQQALEMASAQYDPLIAQLEGQMSSATGRANRGQEEVGKMFNALSSNLQGEVPGIQQMYAEDKSESQALFDQLQQQTQNQYAQTQAEQQDMMNRLNIQAAAPEALAGQQRDKDYFTQLAARDAAVEQTALGREERGAVNYTQQGSQIARAEGTQRQADIAAQLRDLLSQYEGQIGAQRAAKNSTYLANLSQLRGDMQESAQSNAQRDFENYISMVNLGRGLKKDAGGDKLSAVKSPADVASRALGMGLNQPSAQAVQDAFMSAISSDPQILSGLGVFGQSVPKEALAQRVVEAGRNAGLNSQQLNALQTVALEYFGRR